jgi:hypothetical protein
MQKLAMKGIKWKIVCLSIQYSTFGFSGLYVWLPCWEKYRDEKSTMPQTRPNLRNLKLHNVVLKKCLKSKHKVKIIRFLKRAPKFFCGEWKRNERKVPEEHCWAITQATDRSGSGVIHVEIPTRCHSVSKFILYLYEAQPVLGGTPPIIRRLKLH